VRDAWQPDRAATRWRRRQERRTFAAVGARDECVRVGGGDGRSIERVGRVGARVDVGLGTERGGIDFGRDCGGELLERRQAARIRA
jgi:hypothetical protein